MWQSTSFRLNSPALNLESVGQTKIRIAKSLTSLGICGVLVREDGQRGKFMRVLRRILRSMANLPMPLFCHPNHSFNLKFDAFSFRDEPAGGSESITVRFCADNYFELLCKRL